jgi:heat shock protein HtpX
MGIILVSLVVYVISFFLMQALSRYREFAADRGSAIITGRPSALSSALLKISGTMQRIPQTDLRAHAEMNAFYIFPAGAKKSVFNLFSTHPPIEKRIEALSRLEAQLQGTA